ncbi:Myotubularin family [Phytophthora cactorum]|nr:Myotubularin family [Phytophthora cactorum]
MEDTLRLQFGTAATTIGTQWVALQQANGVVKTPHVLAFEAKGRVRRQIRSTPKQQKDPMTWGGNVQVYDQSGAESATGSSNNGLWSWGRLNEHNLVEVDEFRPHMPLHNFYEGHAVSNGGNVGNTTLENAEDRVRTVLETCDQLRLVQGLVDMDSSWGGLAHEMMTYVAEECPGAVIMVVGNDWSYPMATDDEDAVFRAEPNVRDRTKIEARKRINVASSMALLSEVSHLLVPVAMSSSSLPSTSFSQLGMDRSNCGDVATVVATALELALSAHRGRSAYEIMEGLQPSTKVVELAASFPYSTDPTFLLQRISESVTNEVDRKSLTEDPFQNYSLLPAIQQAERRGLEEGHTNKTSYRRLHFRGSFNSNSSLRAAIDSFPVSPRDVALRWSDAFPLKLPETYRLQTLQSSSVDGISQLALSSRTGEYLSNLAQRAAKSDKRTLYEFTTAGMSPDAPEELASALAGMGDAYTREREPLIASRPTLPTKEMDRMFGGAVRTDSKRGEFFLLIIAAASRRIRGQRWSDKNLTTPLHSCRTHHEEELVEVHLHNIAELAEFRVNGKLGPMSQLEVSCKNFELIKFNFPGEAVSGDAYVKISQMLMGKLQPAAYVFARQPDTSGWAAYDPQAEFTRLGFKTPKSGAQIGGFRITHVNNNYKMSPTYPSSFVVPASVSDGELRKMSFFRARGRVPTVTYRHKNDAVVARCAQPLVGLRRKRCTSDEAYMVALRRECKGKLLFIDCRNQTSAYGNIALGGGFEVARTLDPSLMLRCVAKLVEGTSLVIHCSDGWDRTAQITALVKLCADPFYRTVKGFQFPCSFEFSERYLIALLDEVYSKRSGTFLHDNEEARMDAWAKELQVTQRELQDQLSAAHQQLQSQVEQNSDLQSELEQLRRERAQLTRLLEGEVYSDTLNGLLVHEEDENEDGVLLSVTPVGESRTTLETSCSESGSTTPGASEIKVYSTTGVGCFLGGSMSQDFEILQSYFDPMRRETRSVDPTSTGNGCNDLFTRRITVEEVVR